jgi:hypothetical protein
VREKRERGTDRQEKEEEKEVGKHGKERKREILGGI